MAYNPKGYKLLGQLIGANLNATTDQAIAIMQANGYIIDKIIVTNVSTSLGASVTAGGFYTGAGKTGTTIVAAAQVYTSLTAASKIMGLTIALTTDSLTAQTIFFALTTAHGSAATADIYVYGFSLT